MYFQLDLQRIQDLTSFCGIVQLCVCVCARCDVVKKKGTKFEREKKFDQNFLHYVERFGSRGDGVRNSATSDEESFFEEIAVFTDPCATRDGGDFVGFSQDCTADREKCRRRRRGDAD